VAAIAGEAPEVMQYALYTMHYALCTIMVHAPCIMYQVTPYSAPPDLPEVMKPQPGEQAATHEEIAA
jgi:hypothetical protein